MSEIQKHIESCRSEDVLSQSLEACGNENDLQAALQPLLAETMQGYVPVPTTAPTSPIAELPNVLISIIRRVATKPLTMFGDRPAKQSLLGSLVTTWNAIRQRLSGNPSAGIPDRRAEMSAHSLPTALALLNDRKISGVNAEIPDGVSMGRLLCDGSMAATVTEIIDDNDAWDSTTAAAVNRLLTIFTNIKKLKLKFRNYSGYWTPLFNSEVPFTHAELYELTSTTDGIFTNAPQLENNPFRDLETVSVSYAATNATILGFTKIPVVNLGKLKTVRVGAYQSLIRGGEVREIYAEELTSTTSNYNGHSTYSAGFIGNNMPNLQKVKLGTLTGIGYITCNSADALVAPNLLHMEFGEGTSCSINLDTWSPTLDSSNLQQFLQNFRDYIAKRLANRTGLSKLTLTLSANVFSAVFTNESGSTEEIVARNAIRDEIRGEITDRNWKVTDSTNNFNN